MALNPEGLPQLDDGTAVRDGAAQLQVAVGAVSGRAVSIRSGWASIAAHYDAPEAGLVYAAMDEPVTSASDLVVKTGTAATALSTYGDRLDELNAQRVQLVADMTSFNAHREEVTHETSGILGWKDWSGWEKQDLLNKEEALDNRAADFAAAVDEAQRTCANAITAIYGGPQFKAADRASVDDPNVYGLSDEGYDQLGLSGKNAWGAPAGWTDTSWMSASYLTGRGALRSITGLWDMGKALTGFGEDGEASAAWSGLWQLTKDAFYVSPFALMTGISSRQQATESGERLLGVGKSILGIGTWKTSGWNTAGGFVPDILLAIGTGGTAAAAKGGLRGAARGALEASLRRLAPTTATRIGDLNTALRATMRGSYATALTGIRDLGYRGIDAVGDLRRTVSDAPVRAQQWADDLGRRLSPEPVPAGGPSLLPPSSRVWDDGTVARSSTPSATDGWPTHRPSGGSTPSAPGTAPAYAGDAATGMRGAPSHTSATTRVDVGDELMPAAREAFGRGVDLAPSTRYEVRGRGVFYTNADGAVEFVEPMRKTIGSREFMSSDLRDPLPNVTYQVDDYAYFHTDRLARTDHVHVEDLEVRSDTKASAVAHRKVVGGAADTDAGHLLARGLGGAREEINLVQMVRDLNRGHGGRSLTSTNSVRHLELEIERALQQARPGHHTTFDLQVRYSRDGTRPLRFRYLTREDGEVLQNATQVIRNT